MLCFTVLIATSENLQKCFSTD